MTSRSACEPGTSCGDFVYLVGPRKGVLLDPGWVEEATEMIQTNCVADISYVVTA